MKTPRHSKKENTEKEPTPLSVQVEKAIGKNSALKATHKALEKARASGGTFLPLAHHSRSSSSRSMILKRQTSKAVAFEAEQAELMRQADGMRRVALISVVTGGFLTVQPPPHTLELFLRADAEELSVRAVFSFLSLQMVSYATKALLNPCQLNVEAIDQPIALCTGTPSVLKKLKTTKSGKGGFHRKLLTTQGIPSINFVIEPLKS